MSKKDNSILIEFNFLIDLDLAIFKLIKNEYNNADYVDQNIINIDNDNEIIRMMIDRKNINPLSVLIPNMDTDELYSELLKDTESICKYAKVTDIFALMITFLREASSVEVTVLCENEYQSQFIKSLNPILKTIIVPVRSDVDLTSYTVIYTKYYKDILKYKNVRAKHVYIANARYNMDETNNSKLSIPISVYVADVNIIHTIDLYQRVKYERKLDHENIF